MPGKSATGAPLTPVLVLRSSAVGVKDQVASVPATALRVLLSLAESKYKRHSALLAFAVDLFQIETLSKYIGPGTKIGTASAPPFPADTAAKFAALPKESAGSKPGANAYGT